MLRTNLKILFTVAMTLAVFTFIANVIPQVQSAVPEEIEIRADMTPDELVGIGETLYFGVGGCTACHGLGTRAPDILGVAGTVCATRNAGQSCKEYLWESLVSPVSYIVEGFQPIMLDQSRLMSQAELWTLVAFLEAQGGEVTVGPDDFASAAAADEAALAAAAEPPPTDPSAVDVMGILNVHCLACHAYGGQGAMVGPPLEELTGRSYEEIERGILEPNADTAAGYEPFAGVMPTYYGDQLAPAELEALIQFLMEGGAPGGSTDGSVGDDAPPGEDRP